MAAQAAPLLVQAVNHSGLSGFSSFWAPLEDDP